MCLSWSRICRRKKDFLKHCSNVFFYLEDKFRKKHTITGYISYLKHPSLSWAVEATTSPANFCEKKLIFGANNNAHSLFQGSAAFFGAIWLIRPADPIPVIFKKSCKVKNNCFKTPEERRKKIYKDFQKKEDLQNFINERA